MHPHVVSLTIINSFSAPVISRTRRALRLPSSAGGHSSWRSIGRRTEAAERSLAFRHGKRKRNIILEMDVLEVLFLYGILGVFTMLWSYAGGLQFISRVVKRLDIMGCASLLRWPSAQGI
jgi:hypothetical protein